ncbi:hypothetical protein [Sphingobacterium sp.]|uniref:hypothetical protein n=1 Tax=Sphingobacterium sp. TaxID=341027 RepID=UPI0028AC6728|nr:hypothetical protein [Sphingobacterium sp.]
MAYKKVSIAKGHGSPGAPKAKDPNIIILLARDILTMPARDGVKITTNITLKPGTVGIGLYLTPSSIKRNDNSEGDPDKEGWIQNVVGVHPGDSLEVNEFLEANLGEDFILITKECSTAASVKVHGSLCAPLKLTVEEQDDSEGVGKTLTWKSALRSNEKSVFYTGVIPTIAEYTGDTSSTDGL